MHRLLSSLLTLTLSIAATTATAAQSPEVRARIDAYVKAVGNLEPPNAVRIGRAIAEALFAR